ncbi:glucan endo-1,3-beta-glucosidase 13-like [Zingiber officinale]|uniref:glucan endo-1,3-beta-glucosidase 13-like n=1 Tax=Zingiber officinale TaxID=94328 RepID=UPI001C4D1891|nr:glucan endo-1,3-beta-glucosidase 13-like [Zingiber officinale]
MSKIGADYEEVKGMLLWNNLKAIHARAEDKGMKAALAATISSGRGPWCVAKPEAPREALQANIEYVCGGAIGDCSAIQEGASCYSTDIVRQASYAMNSFYYAKGGHRSINCFFNETGTKVRDDPSYGNCAALAATISSGRGPWCVAKPEAPREALQANIEYVCGGAIGDCSAIQEGASCYSTDIVRQASYAMNSFYYAKGGHRSINCFFNETGTKVRDDPSYGNCVYPS